MSNYDFSKIKKTKKKDKPDVVRPNFKVARCCGNCKFYWYYKGNQRRGNCKLPEPNLKKINKSKGESYYSKETREDWDKVHITCVCDFHQFRSIKGSIHQVGDYCGVKFNSDGTEKEDEE
tara:strand:- start:449 stop:808 length:360 start_codon:yes stop_codon:yes gene_type:complete